ncbi:MAG: hypothetical protein CMH64_04480 [Nanoarchaeota archaeon]|nr:hypothetical protein [Nanoarchaeota archaeon]
MEATPSMHMETVDDPDQDIQSLEDQSRSYKITVPLVKETITAENLAIMKGASNCNGTTPGLVAFENLWFAEGSVHNKLTGKRVYASGEIKNSTVTAQEGMKLASVINRNPSNYSTLVTTATYDESERERITQAYNDSVEASLPIAKEIIDGISGEIGKPALKAILKSLKMTLPKLLHVDNRETLQKLITGIRNTKSPMAAHKLEKRAQDYYRAAKGIFDYGDAVNNNDFGFGVEIYDFVRSGTRLEIGGVEAVVEKNHALEEDEFFGARVVYDPIDKKRVVEQYTGSVYEDAPDLDTIVQQQKAA